MLLPLLLCSPLLQEPAPAAGAAAADPPQPQGWLTLEAVDARGRRPFRPDAVFRRHLHDPASPAPAAGDEVTGSTGSAAWRPAEPGEDGFLNGVGWGYATVRCQRDRVVMAELTGATTLFVNGEAFVGDHYRFGHRGVPVALREGENRLYVTGVRGGFRLRLWQPDGPVQFAGWTPRRPDLVAGRPVAGEIGLAVMNATAAPLARVELEAGGEGPFARRRAELPHGLPPLAVARLAVELAPDLERGLPEEPAPQQLRVAVSSGFGPQRVDSLGLDMRGPGQAYRRTYRSSVDGAVCEFTVLPPAGDPAAATGLVLSLHGASVPSYNQASSYALKPDRWLVAPTNRAPYGFDWQDWGRIDALAVMELMLEEKGLDPARTVVTGHSMGGHGTWSLAVNDPDRFAAVAPSAGWCSFDTYVPRPDGALRELWHAADGSSDTLDMLSNLKGKPIYVLHGDADDNVPPSEAAIMAAAMDERGIAYQMHLEPGAGHWWTDDRYPGAECMDWPPIFAMFEDARLPERPLELDWSSVGPWVDAEHFWLRVEQPERYGEKLRVKARYQPDPGAVTVETENVRALWIGVPHTLARIDRQDFLADPEAGGAWYRRVDGHWQQASGGAPAEEQRPDRSGPFRRAFDRRFALVYATGGSAEEQRESLARARFDSQRWFYRAFGDAPLVPDTALLDPERQAEFAGRNLILYGNADTNRAWGAVVPEDCPLQARRGAIHLGEREWTGEDKAALFVFPRAGEAETLVGAFADTGAAGARLGYTLSPFLAGVGVPDYAIYDAEVLASGDGGVLAAGWWDHGWRPQEAGAYRPAAPLQSPVR